MVTTVCRMRRDDTSNVVKGLAVVSLIDCSKGHSMPVCIDFSLELEEVLGHAAV